MAKPKKEEKVKRRPLRRGKAIALTAGGIVLVTVVTICLLWAVMHQDVLGAVNGMPFYTRELAMYAERNRAGVAAQVAQRHNLSVVGESFWDTDYDGEIPRDTLLQKSLDDLVRDKVIQQEAVARGVDAPADFLKTEQALITENENRKNTSASGGIIYGPTGYSISEYVRYRMTQTTDDLKGVLLEGDLQPTEQQLRAAYDSLDESFKRKAFTALGVLYRWDSGQDDVAIAAQVKKLAAGGASPEEIAAAQSAIAGFAVEDFLLDSEEVHREDLSAQFAADALFFADAGTFSDLVQDGLSRLYYVKEKEGGGYYAFEETIRLSQNKWINDAFDAMIEEKIAAAKVTVSANARDFVL